MRCDKCGSCVSIEEHHIHPKFMNNLSGEGKKLWLCRSCHQIIHQNIIPSVLWMYIQDFGYGVVSWKNKVQCIEAVKRRTLSWLEEKEF